MLRICETPMLTHFSVRKILYFYSYVKNRPSYSIMSRMVHVFMLLCKLPAKSFVVRISNSGDDRFAGVGHSFRTFAPANVPLSGLRFPHRHPTPMSIASPELSPHFCFFGHRKSSHDSKTRYIPQHKKPAPVVNGRTS